MIGWLWLLGCGAPSSVVAAPEASVVHAEEAYDVPPPPGHRTVRVHGVGTPHPLGSWLVFRDAAGGEIARGDLVDREPRPPSLTVYVPEAQADALLDHRGPVAIDL